MENQEVNGTVVLWSGWTIDLPRARAERNEDGSWSAWGGSWTIDVSIVEVSGDSSGQPASASHLLGEIESERIIRGEGWIGSKRRIEETDEGRHIFRTATKLCADNTIMNCWISVLSESELGFADSIISSIAHRVT